jgi:hypothetical protein
VEQADHTLAPAVYRTQGLLYVVEGLFERAVLRLDDDVVTIAAVSGNPS